jgi:hypothetical protein
MLNILTKTSKILLGIFIATLLIMFFSFSENMAFFIFMWIAPIIGLITLIFLTNNIKKSKKSKIHKLVSIVLLNVVIFSSIVFFWGLNISGLIQLDLGIIGVMFFYGIIIGLSLIINIILVSINKEYIYDESPKNWILLIVALFLLICIFYVPIITNTSVLVKSPHLCSLQLEIKENSFMFSENSGDSCVNNVVRFGRLTTIDSCDLVKSNFYKTGCIRRIALNTGDISYCYNIGKEESERGISIGSCLRQVAVDIGDASICELPEMDRKDDCLRDVARGD